LKSVFSLLTGLGLLSLSASAQYGDLSPTEPRFATYPTLSPDARTLVFSFENDLWRTDLSSGLTTRLTAMQGTETRARFSPDGQWIAFTGSQYGNADVYLLPAAGGEVRQLTFHDSYDLVEGWSWDSKTIYFESGAFNGGTAYTVALTGGTPKRLFGHYFNRIHNVAEHPTSGELFFNDTWESDNQAYRKRYKGAFNPDIQSYNAKTKAYRRYTDYAGKDLWATLDRAGNLYFASDEANDEYNLYAMRDGKKTALTQFPDAIKHPQVSADGRKVVFEKDYQLWLYDVASAKSEPVRLSVVRNFTLPKAQDFNVRNNLTAFDVSPDGKKLAFSSRGELFVSDVEGKFVRLLKTAPLGRVLEVKWLADNRTVLFNQTVNGYLNWFTIPADGSGTEKQLTSDLRNNRDLALNKSRTKAVYLSGRDEVRLLDLKTFASKSLVKEEIWAFQNSVPSFSPNDEYVLFTSHRDFEQDIFVHHLASGRTLNLTQTGISEITPTWSPDGKYLFFASNRLRPSYPFGLGDSRIYRLPLSKIDEPYRSDKFADLFRKDEKKEVKPDSVVAFKSGKGKKVLPTVATAKPAEKKDEAPKLVPIAIDTVELMDRLELISPNMGIAVDPEVVQKDAKTFVVYSSNHQDGKFNLWKTTIEPFVPNKTEAIAGSENASNFVNVDGKYFVLIGGNVHKLNLDANRVEKVDIAYTFRRNLADEFRQMFDETWANVAENFYNETFHGADWATLRTKYAAYLPYLNTRADFRLLLNDLMGELNSSHTGFGSFGPEESNFFRTQTLNTGLLFDDEVPYRVKAVIKNSALDKVGKDVRPGDVLVKVNEVPVEAAQNRDFYFQQPSMDGELELTFERGGKPHTVKLHPQSSGATNSLLYDEWIDQNQRYVDEKSKNRIAYVHLQNMGRQEFDKFVVDMTRDWYKKDALILDLRYNTGGNVHDLVLNFLSQRPYLQWKYREGALTPQPNFGVAGKPIVLLINEQSLSDAEMTAQGFKALKLGKVIGTETYRWIIFTSGKGLVDGSFYRLPSWGCYTLDGKNLEAEGVQPDLVVPQTFTDRLDGKEPQLDRAIGEILGALPGK
jgi:tricorn protease